MTSSSSSSSVTLLLQNHPEFTLVDEKIPKWLNAAQEALQQLSRELQVPIKKLLQELKIDPADVNYDLEDEEFIDYEDG